VSRETDSYLFYVLLSTRENETGTQGMGKREGARREDQEVSLSGNARDGEDEKKMKIVSAFCDVRMFPGREFCW